MGAVARLTGGIKMRFQVVLSEEETEKWESCGEDEDLFRSTARALLRQTITEIPRAYTLK